MHDGLERDGELSNLDSRISADGRERPATFDMFPTYRISRIPCNDQSFYARHADICVAKHDSICNDIPMPNEDVNITTRQLAARISVDPSTVRRWVEDGKLTPSVVTPGGHYRFNAGTALNEIKAHANKKVAA